MRLLRSLIENHPLANIAFVVVIVMGILAYSNMPREQDPEINFNWVNISTALPGASAADIEERVTNPLEDAIRNVQDTRFVVSTSREGVSNILVRFREINERTFDKRINDLRREIQNKANTELPADVIDPNILEITTSNGFPTAMVVLTGQAEDETLRSAARSVKEDLEQLTGVDKVLALGFQDPELLVEFDPGALASRGLTAAALSDSLRLWFRDVFAGKVSTRDGEWLVRVSGTSADPERRAVTCALTSTLRLGEEGQLFTRAERGRDAMQLLDIAEAGADQQAAVRQEVAERRATAGQPVIEFGGEHRVGFWHAVEDEVAAFDPGRRAGGEGRGRRQQDREEGVQGAGDDGTVHVCYVAAPQLRSPIANGVLMADPRLRQKLERKEFIVAPGVFDMMSTMLAVRVGFDAIYASGYWLTASYLGIPDAGIATYTDMLARITKVVEKADVPVIADADTGFGGLLNVHHTVKGYERVGVSAIQIEDQEFPKKCGHTPYRRVVPMADMVAKIKVAVDARSSRDFLVIARTDARGGHGFEAAVRRGQAYAEAGADIVFVEALHSEDEMRQACAAIAAPMMANMSDGGKTPIRSARELGALGYQLAIYPAMNDIDVGRVIEVASTLGRRYLRRSDPVVAG